MHPRMIKENIFYEKHALQARLMKQNAMQAGFCDSVLMVTLSY